MALKHSLTIAFLLVSLGVICYAKTFKFDSVSIEIDSLKKSKTKEFLWGNRKAHDYRVLQKHDRTRRGSSGTKSLTVKYDGIEKVTEIVLEVTSENDDVTAKIIKGGVGKDQAKIEITGHDTSFLEYNIEVFGRP